MTLLRELGQNLIADALRERAGQHDAGFVFEHLQLVVELVVLEVRHDLRAVDVIGLRRGTERFDELPHPLHTRVAGAGDVSLRHCLFLCHYFTSENAAIHRLSRILMFPSCIWNGYSIYENPIEHLFSFILYAGYHTSLIPISSGVTSRYWPGLRLPSVSFMMRMRLRRTTSKPSDVHIRRICRFKPCVRTMWN